MPTPNTLPQAGHEYAYLEPSRRVLCIGRDPHFPANYAFASGVTRMANGVEKYGTVLLIPESKCTIDKRGYVFDETFQHVTLPMTPEREALIADTLIKTLKEVLEEAHG